MREYHVIRLLKFSEALRMYAYKHTYTRVRLILTYRLKWILFHIIKFSLRSIQSVE